MATATWKAVERKVAALLGGSRVGATGRNTEDVKHDLFSIEVKHRKRLPVFVTKALDQCKRNAPEGKIPLVVLHQTNSRQYLCVIEIDALKDLIDGS